MKEQLEKQFIKRLSHALEWGSDPGNSRECLEYINGLKTMFDDALNIMDTAPAQAKPEETTDLLKALALAGEVCDKWNFNPNRMGKLDVEYKYYPSLKSNSITATYYLPEGKVTADGSKCYFFDNLEKPENMASLVLFLNTGNLPGTTIKGAINEH